MSAYLRPALGIIKWVIALGIVSYLGYQSREQFELRTHKRLIDIVDSRHQTIEALTKLDLPAGVDVEIKVD